MGKLWEGELCCDQATSVAGERVLITDLTKAVVCGGVCVLVDTQRLRYACAGALAMIVRAVQTRPGGPEMMRGSILNGRK
jgi:hypothetical protein